MWVYYVKDTELVLRAESHARLPTQILRADGWDTYLARGPQLWDEIQLVTEDEAKAAATKQRLPADGWASSHDGPSE